MPKREFTTADKYEYWSAIFRQILSGIISISVLLLYNNDIQYLVIQLICQFQPYQRTVGSILFFLFAQVVGRFFVPFSWALFSKSLIELTGWVV